MLVIATPSLVSDLVAYLSLAVVGIAPFIIPAVLAGASFLGGLFGNKGKQTQTPAFDPAFSGLRDALLPHILSRLRKPFALPEGFATSGVADINRAYAGAEQGLENRLTSRGLASSPVAAAGLTRLHSARAGDIGRFQAGLPLIEEEIQRQNLLDALQALSLGRGATTTTSAGGGIGGGISGLASMLGFLYGTGSFRGGNLPFGRTVPPG